MITTLTTGPNTEYPFRWIDLSEPTPEELQKLSHEFGIHETSLQDSLEPYHLPKYERHDHYTFIILRSIDPLRPSASSDINELTRKTAVFMGEQFLITLHRSPLSFIQALQEKWAKRLPHYTGTPHLHLCLDILSQGLNTFDPPIDEALEV